MQVQITDVMCWNLEYHPAGLDLIMVLAQAAITKCLRLGGEA